MRNLTLMVFVLAASAPLMPNTLSAQEHELLYTAIVANDDVEVLSGPGKKFYATHRLNQNTLVEVYREDPGGLCMIKPPERSFSLIPAKSVKMLSDQVAEVVIDGVDAWVGTSLGLEVEPMSQLRLKTGDRVWVLGEVHWEGSPIVYLQIEAPAGEFRWVRSSDLQIPPEQVAGKRSSNTENVDFSEPPEFSSEERAAKASPAAIGNSNSNPEAVKSGFTEGFAKPDSRTVTYEQPVAKQANPSAASNSGWQKAKRPFPKNNGRDFSSEHSYSKPSTTSSEWTSGQDFMTPQSFDVDRPIDDSRFGQWSNGSPESQNRPPRFASLDSMDRQARSIVRSSQPSSFDRATSRSSSSSLIAIEDSLSVEILKDPEEWNLAELKFQAERLRAKSDDAVERLALQHVLDKIEECDALSKKFQRTSPRGNRSSDSISTTSEYSVQYDAVGWLKKLANNQGRIDPVYVLQDDVGRVTHHIKGIAGMNLGQYADQKVGLFGKRGFHQGLGKKHVTAERIVVLR